MAFMRLFDRKKLPIPPVPDYRCGHQNKTEFNLVEDSLPGTDMPVLAIGKAYSFSRRCSVGISRFTPETGWTGQGDPLEYVYA